MVQCTVLTGCETTMKHTMDWAREAIDLQEIGVQDLVIRRTMTGGILLGIKGQKGQGQSADWLVPPNVHGQRWPNDLSGKRSFRSLA